MEVTVKDGVLVAKLGNGAYELCGFTQNVIAKIRQLAKEEKPTQILVLAHKPLHEKRKYIQEMTEHSLKDTGIKLEFLEVTAKNTAIRHSGKNSYILLFDGCNVPTDWVAHALYFYPKNQALTKLPIHELKAKKVTHFPYFCK